MRMSSSRIARLHASPAYQTAMEGLEKLLQDTGTSVEGLLSGYIAASVKLLGPEVSDVRSSLSMGMAPTLFNSRQEAQTNAFYKDDAAASDLEPAQFQASANIVQCLDVQNWSPQSPSSLLCHENSSDVFAPNDDGNDATISLPGTFIPHKASNDEDALWGLLDEVKKTVFNWLLRHKTIVQDRLSRNAALDVAAASPGLCLPNDAPFLVGFEREESPVVCMSPSGNNMTDEEGYLTQEEQKNRLGNVHPTQNDGGKGGEFVQQNQEEGNRCGLLPQQDKEVGHFSLEIEMEKSVHLDKAVEDIPCQLQSDKQPLAGRSQDLVGGEPAAELSPAESLSTDVNVASTAAIAGSAPLLKKNGLAAEEGNRGGLLPQQDKEAGHPSLEIETERSVYLDEVVDGIALQLQSDEQPMAGHSQGLVGGEPASGLSQAESLSTDVNVASTAANSANTPLLKENGLAAESLISPTNTDRAEIQLSITKWTPPASTIDKSLSFPRAVKVVSSPDWLPEGWVTELKTRGTGNSAGTKDKYYVDPVSNRRFRSRKEVVAYLERGKSKPSGGNPDTSLVKKLPAPQLLPALPNIANKRAKVKESGTHGTSAKPSPLVSPIASAGLIGNVFMPPFRTGQPSEWLSYESVGSLPFPMFDPFYHRDMSAKKSTSSGKAPPVSTRPGFFTGPADSWNPFRDRSTLAKPADKGRDYQSYFSMPSYPSGVVPKPFAGLVKKSSK